MPSAGYAAPEQYPPPAYYPVSPVAGAPEVDHQRTGGVDLQSDTVNIGGDVVGRDKITYINAPSAKEVEQQRRVEATFPTQPAFGQIESLYVQVKMPQSPARPEAQGRAMAMPFRADVGTGTALPTPFRIKVTAPGFRIYGGDEKTLRVPPDRDSIELEFQLQCETDRPVKVQVEIYSESGLLGQVELPVTPLVVQPIPVPSARMWVRAVFVLGTLPNVTVSTSW